MDTFRVEKHETLAELHIGRHPLDNVSIERATSSTARRCAGYLLSILVRLYDHEMSFPVDVGAVVAIRLAAAFAWALPATVSRHTLAASATDGVVGRLLPLCHVLSKRVKRMGSHIVMLLTISCFSATSTRLTELYVTARVSDRPEVECRAISNPAPKHVKVF